MAIPTQTFNVGSQAALNSAIETIDQDGSGNFAINLTADISVSPDGDPQGLYAIDTGATVVIDGNGYTLSGGGTAAADGSTDTGLAVLAGKVTIENLTLEDTVAKGADGEGSGGGGAGLGGGLFVGSNASVTLDEVSFLNDQAQGGNGGPGGGGGAGGNSSLLVPNIGGNGADGGSGPAGSHGATPGPNSYGGQFNNYPIGGSLAGGPGGNAGTGVSGGHGGLGGKGGDGGDGGPGGDGGAGQANVPSGGSPNPTITPTFYYSGGPAGDGGLGGDGGDGANGGDGGTGGAGGNGGGGGDGGEGGAAGFGRTSGVGGDGGHGGNGSDGGDGGYGGGGGAGGAGGQGGQGGAGAYDLTPSGGPIVDTDGGDGGMGGDGGNGGDGGFGGGGGGGGNGGDGGGGGHTYFTLMTNGNGGDGGNAGNGGRGGYGGGGGGGGTVGKGGDGIATGAPGTQGGGGNVSGFGAGDGGAGSQGGGGGGGLGAGGDIFVATGGSLIIEGGLLSGGAAVESQGVQGAIGGAGVGDGIFLQGGQNITLSATSAQPLVVDDPITDQSGAGGAGVYAGTAGINVAGTGTVELANHNAFGSGIDIELGTLELAATGAAGSGPIKFDPGTLEFAPANAPSNPIENFGAGDQIIIDDFQETGASFTDGHLVLDSAGGPVSLNILGFTSVSQFDVVDNVAADTTTVTPNPCYCPGTLIRTANGEVAIEQLKIGDRVMTASAAARPIKWIGRRSYAGRYVMGRTDIVPICIKAGALDTNMPKRDLWVSPNHAMYFEDADVGGVLIEAKDLVNGVSIVQAESVQTIEYFHIELDTHDIIIAEGALSESFIDDDSRGIFNNAHEYRVLYPAAADNGRSLLRAAAR